MASATEWRIDRGKPEAMPARTRLRAPYRVLAGVFGSDGDAVYQAAREDARVSTAWMLKKKNGGAAVLVYDRQADDDRKFNLEAFRARPHYDWFVVGKDDATLKDFCTWLSREIIKRVEAEPQPRRLTARAKEKLNALVAEGKSVSEAMKLAAEWEVITPAAEAYKWPIPGDNSGEREKPAKTREVREREFVERETKARDVKERDVKERDVKER